MKIRRGSDRDETEIKPEELKGGETDEESVKNKTKESLVLQHFRSSHCSGHSCHPAVLFTKRRIVLQRSSVCDI